MRTPNIFQFLPAFFRATITLLRLFVVHSNFEISTEVSMVDFHAKRLGNDLTLNLALRSPSKSPNCADGVDTVLAKIASDCLVQSMLKGLKIEV